MTLARKIAANTLVQIVGRALTTALALIVVAALTRYLGVAGYGNYATIFAYVSFFGVLADFGFFWIMMREISLPNAETEKIVSNVLTLRTIFGLVVFLVGFGIAWLIPQYAIEVKLGIGVISIAWLWLALNSTFVGVFQTNLRMDKAVLTDLLGRIVVLAGVLLLISRGGSFLAILGFYALGNFINFLASLILGRQFVRIRPAFDWQVWRRIFAEAWPMGVVLILHSIYFKVDTVMLSLMQSSTDVGIYGAPFKVLEVLITVPVMFLGNVFPTLTRYLETKDQRLPQVFQQAFDVLAIIALPLIVGTVILARPILSFVAGNEYVTASTVNFLNQPASGVITLQILIIAVGIAFFSSLFNYLMIASGRQRSLIAPNLVFVLTNVGANLILIPILSYVGASLTTVFTEIIVVGTLGWIVWKLTDLRPSLERIGRILAATGLMGIVVWFTKELPLALPVTAALLTYPVFLWLFGVVTPEMIRSLRKSD